MAEGDEARFGVAEGLGDDQFGWDGSDVAAAGAADVVVVAGAEDDDLVAFAGDGVVLG